MEPGKLIKTIAFGFLPLIVFIAADNFFSDIYGQKLGLKYSLISALITGVILFLVTLIKNKKPDYMLLFDTGLILLFGAISFFSGNEIFFKLKPAFVQFILVIMLAVIGFLSPKLLFILLGRFSNNLKIENHQIKLMQSMCKGMFLVFFFHTSLIIYSAFYMSKEAWGFISGGLFYILMGLYFALIFIKNKILQHKIKKNHTSEELIELKDSKGRSMGKYPASAIKRNKHIFKNQT